MIATTPVKMTIADTTIGLVGFKFGVSAGRLGKGIPFKDSFELLGDYGDMVGWTTKARFWIGQAH